MWFWIAAFVFNDVLIGFTFWQLWRKNFFLHVVFCDGCGEPQIVPVSIYGMDECGSCHVCGLCGKWIKCETCGKEHLVRQEIEGIRFCDSIGCHEKYLLNEKKLARLNKRKEKNENT